MCTEEGVGLVLTSDADLLAVSLGRFGGCILSAVVCTCFWRFLLNHQLAVPTPLLITDQDDTQKPISISGLNPRSQSWAPHNIKGKTIRYRCAGVNDVKPMLT